MCFLRLRHRYLFRHLSNFGAGEPVGECERGRPSPLPSLFGSCLNAHASPHEHRPLVVQLMQFSSLGVVFSIYCACSFRFSFARSFCCRSVLVSISRFEMRILDFLLEMSLAHQLPSAIILLFVASSCLLSADVQQVFQLFRLFNLHLVQTLQTCCQ